MEYYDEFDDGFGFDNTLGYLKKQVAKEKYGNKPCTKTKETKLATKDTLYEIKDEILGVRFGNKLAVNSQGQWVMEIKGTGEVLAVDSKTVSKVVPFTIAIQFTDMGTTYHYLADSTEGYKIGDFAVVAGYNGNAFQLARVVDVDTKSESATKHFQPLKRL